MELPVLTPLKLAMIQRLEECATPPTFDNMTPIAQVVAGPRVYHEYLTIQRRKEWVYEGTLLAALNRVRAQELADA